MKTTLPLLLLTIFFVACASKKDQPAIDKKIVGTLPTEKTPELEKIAEFHGAQVTGVTVADNGRIFANFPRWRDDIPFSVVEVLPDGSHKPYPDKKWNSGNGKPAKHKFVSVQSVLAHNNSLYVLDPSSPMMKGVKGSATLYEFDLASNSLKNSWVFPKDVAPEKSYLNDLRVDGEKGKIYITDSGLGGIVVLDLASRKATRLLDQHPSTKAEDIVLSVEKTKFFLDGKPAQVHSDGIALSQDEDRLYYHALTGYNLYSIPTDAITNPKLTHQEIGEKVAKEGITPAPDGMIFDEKGNLYMGDLERNAISYRKPSGEMKILIQDERIKWPDSLTIDRQRKNLIFTDSLLYDAKPGEDVDGMVFNIYRVKLPAES